MRRNEKELSFSASDVNFWHLCCWLTHWLPQVSGDPRILGHSCKMTIVSFELRFLPLSWCSINLLICVKKVILLSFCHVNYIECNFQQMKLGISMISLLVFRAYIIILCLLISVLDHLWITSMLFVVNIFLL